MNSKMNPMYLIQLKPSGYEDYELLTNATQIDEPDSLRHELIRTMIDTMYQVYIVQLAQQYGLNLSIWNLERNNYSSMFSAHAYEDFNYMTYEEADLRYVVKVYGNRYIDLWAALDVLSRVLNKSFRVNRFEPCPDGVYKLVVE